MYKNEGGNLHPIFRNKAFMDSNKGKQQKLTDRVSQSSAPDAPGNPTTSGNPTAPATRQDW